MIPKVRNGGYIPFFVVERKRSEACFKGCTGLTDISLSSDTKLIGKSAFEDCTALKTVILWGDPNIEDRAFMGCTALDSISIGSDTEYIGASAFEGCSNLESAILWGSDTKVGKGAFDNCPKLDHVSQW